jgi:peptidoglycan/LPS O-acetylase OafA/YrhL
MTLALSYNATVVGFALCLPAALRLRRAPAWFEGPVRWLSSRSYALYIIHWTVLVDFVQGKLWWPGNKVPTLPCAILAIVLPFILAELSYRFLEGPILRHRPRQEPSVPAAPQPTDRKSV